MTVIDPALVAGMHDPNLLVQVENVDKDRTVEPLWIGSRSCDSLRCFGFATSSR
jgi:hypothetical protein